MSWQTLRWPLAISWLVTLLRLCGELCGWSPILFGTAAGGGGAVIGIGWLVPLFGWWFGLQLARSGEPAPGRALACIGIGIGTVFAAFAAVKLWIGPTPTGMAIAAVSCAAGAAIAYRGWPRLCRWLLLYAVLARVPIAIITAVAIARGFGTHYEKLADGAPEVAPLARFAILMLAQVTLWLPITVLLGGLAGVLAARPHAGRAAIAQ